MRYGRLVHSNVIGKVFSTKREIQLRLRFWFDILTPKQVMFFRRAVNVLRDLGHEVLCTSRQYREAVELAKLKSLDLRIIGAHGGADKYDKLRASAQRIYSLAQEVSQFVPDAAITFSSPEAARVAYGLGIPHLGFNDSPHAEAVARLTVPLMNTLHTPWVIPYGLWTRYGIPRTRIEKYRALDPAAWLKHRDQPVKSNSPTRNRRILVRMEEAKASYITDRRLSVDISLIDSLVERFSETEEIAILCRYEDQIRAVSDHFRGRATVIDRVVDGTELIESSDIFIGGGGTMTCEAALMGKPAISIAPMPYYIEGYLVRSGLAKRVTNSRSLLRLVERILNNEELKKRQKTLAGRLLARMEDPTQRIVHAATAAHRP